MPYAHDQAPGRKPGDIHSDKSDETMAKIKLKVRLMEIIIQTLKSAHRLPLPLPLCVSVCACVCVEHTTPCSPHTPIVSCVYNGNYWKYAKPLLACPCAASVISLLSAFEAWNSQTFFIHAKKTL